MGFDTEVVGRLFMVQSPTSTSPSTLSSSSSSTSSVISTPSTAFVHSSSNELRMVDLIWDILMSNTDDGTVAVIDGASMLLTPLAYHTVPPPMSMYQQVVRTFPYLVAI